MSRNVGWAAMTPGRRTADPEPAAVLAEAGILILDPARLASYEMPPSEL